MNTDAKDGLDDTNPDLRRSADASMSLGNQTLLQVLSAVGDFNAHRSERGKESSAQAQARGQDTSEVEEDEEDLPEIEERGLSSAEDGAAAIARRVESSAHAQLADELAGSIAAIHRPIEFQTQAFTEQYPPARSQDEVEQQYGAGAGHQALCEDNVEIGQEIIVNTAPDSTKPISHAVSTKSTVSRKSTKEARAQRRAKLAVMLKDVFGLEQAEEVIAEFPCWLFRSILLQGYLYLTEGHICFYAYIRNKEGKTIRSGSLAKRSNLTGRFARHWFILRDGNLTWYPSSTEPYFPDGDVSLQYCTAVEPSKKYCRQFSIFSADRRLRFQADSEASRDDWVRILRKAVFQCQNEGESVKISLPLETVTSIERSELDFLDVLRVQVSDQDSGFSPEEYPFCYFANIADALAQLRGHLANYHVEHPRRVSITPMEEASEQDSGADTPAISKAVAPAKLEPVRASLSASLRNPLGSMRRPRGTDTVKEAVVPETEITTDAMISSNATMQTVSQTPPATSLVSSDEGFSYPPQSAGPQPVSLGQDPGWSGWIKGGGSSLQRVTSRIPGFSRRRKVSEVLSRPRRNVTGASARESAADHDAHSDSEEDQPSMEERFHTAFSMPETEELLAVFPAYLFRLLPVYGKLYISSHFICFRATNLVSKAKMILPLRDIIAVEQHRGSRLGYYGLVLTIKGHEELFFEVNSKKRCSQIRRLLSDKLEAMQNDMTESRLPGQLQEYDEAEKLRRLEPSSLLVEPTPPLYGSVTEAPPVMFRSDSSSFVTFRPTSSLHVTCLTIGSRGDVQPYIALCKGLIKHGHSCRIASHAEYQDWIEGHGIEFRAVGGDPAELMRICVDNGMFTVSFLREGISKFRGWLDDLLKTSWQACQGTDLLIESPSAMAGIHIAEALQVPYYRAFTMPWTKTRAYPHAFAVPEHKLGGQYNSLSYSMFDSIFWKAIANQINQWRKTTLGLHSTSQDKMEANKTPFLYNFSPAIVPPPLDWPEWIHISGYWFLEQPDDTATKKWCPPETLVAFLAEARESKKRVIYIGFGSIVVSDPEALTRTVSEAVRRSDVYAVVSKGWSDRLASKNDSAQVKQERAEREIRERSIMNDRIYSVSAIPHDWLFDRIDAACHHGGAGTTGASLRAGIPTIIRPFFGDQYFWAARIEALGIGTSLRKLTVEALAEAITSATTNEKQIARAQLIGQRIRAENGVEAAVESIYRDLEYAKTLIKRGTRRQQVDVSAEEVSAKQPTTRPSVSSARSTSRRASSSWPSAQTGSDEEESSWDHLSRGSRADSDDVLSRSGLDSSPFLSPTASSNG